MKSFLTSASLLLLVCNSGCGLADRSHSSEPVVEDSAGVTIVLNSASSGPQAEAWSLATTPELRIGVVEGDSMYQFYRVAAVRSLPDERIVVANGSTRELRFFDRAGQFISRAGGDGGGPGEFRAIDRLSVVQDSIWVSDPRLVRVSVFTLEGQFARSFPLSAALDMVWPRLLGVFGNGTLLVESGVLERGEAAGIQPIHSTYYHLDRSGAILDTLGQFVAGQHLVQLGERGPSSVRLPFGRISTVATGDTSFYFGSAEHYEARRYSIDGRLDRIIRRAKPPKPVAPQDLERYIETVAKLNPDPNARQRLQAMYRGTPLPATLPAYSGFRVDSEDYLWVEEYRLLADTLSRWSVFDKDGEYVGTLDLPPRFTLHEIGPDFVLGVRVDGSEVEYIERYRLRKSASKP